MRCKLKIENGELKIENGCYTGTYSAFLLIYDEDGNKCANFVVVR